MSHRADAEQIVDAQSSGGAVLAAYAHTTPVISLQVRNRTSMVERYSAADSRWRRGRTVRILSVVDVHTRECVALQARQSFRGEDVGAVLSTVALERPLPAMISVDQGTEFTSRALDHWAYRSGVQLDFSRPGKPTDNAHVEAFHGSLRRECLSQHWWKDLAEVQQTLDAWKADYNNMRAHSGSAHQPPAGEKRGGGFIPPRERLLI